MTIARDLVLMGIGGAGMIREIFFRPDLDMIRAGLFITMILGSAAVNAVGLLRGTATGGPSSSSPPSSSPPPPPG